MREVIAAAEAASGKLIARRNAPRRAGDPPVLVADPSRAGALLGWRAELSDLDTIIGTALTWHSNRLGMTRRQCVVLA